MIEVEHSTLAKVGGGIASAWCRGLGSRDGAAWYLRARIRCFQKGKAELSVHFWVACPQYLLELKIPHMPWMNHSSSQHSDTTCVVSSRHLLLQLSDASSVSYSSVQFRHYLPGVSIRSHKLRAQSHSTVPTSDASRKSQAVTGTPDWPAINPRGSHNPILRASSLLEWLTEWLLNDSGKCFTCYHQFIIKDTTQDQPMEEIHRVRHEGRGSRVSMPSLDTPPSQHLHVFNNPEALRILSLRGFMGVSLHRHDWVNHWPLVINSTPSSFPLPWSQQ